MAFRTQEEFDRVYYRRKARLRRRLLPRRLLSAFIVWHLFALLVWNAPTAVSWEAPFVAMVRPYMTSTGLMQGWGMFAPDPWRVDTAVEARIHYAGGAVRSWYFPRMARLSLPVRYTKERWRKYVELISQNSYGVLWPAAARYAARVNDVRAGDPPVQVDLISHWRKVAIIGDPPAPTNVEPLYSTPIVPKDLRK